MAGSGHGGGGWHGGGGGGWRGGWGYPGWGWGGPLWDRSIVLTDATSSGAEPVWTKCKLKSPVSYYDASGTARAIPSGTVVLSAPDGGGYIRINWGGQIVRATTSVCEPVSGMDGKGKRYHVYSSADGATDIATAKAVADRASMEKKIQSGFILAGIAAGLYIAFKHKQKGLLDIALTAVFGAGAGAIVGWAAKGSMATLMTPKEATK